MHDSDSRADNIFSRLMSYTPRVGEARKRTALEDYYTEALAWCLRSPEFRRHFLDLIEEQAGLSLPQGHEDEIEVHTQLGFTQADDEEGGDEDSPSGARRRFDLVISSKPRFVIVVEDKVQWHFTDDQISAYQNELENGKLFKSFGLKLLVLLSPSGKKPDNDKHSILVIALRWSAVQQKLAEFAEAGEKRPHDWLNLPVVRSMCGQFADFLKEKGLEPMTLDPANNDRVTSWIGGFEAR